MPDRYEGSETRMNANPTSYKQWHMMSPAWRLVVLVPPLCIAGAVVIGAVLFASTVTAKVAALLSILATIQATRALFRNRSQNYRGAVLLPIAMAAGSTIKPLAVEPLHWQVVILLTLLGGTLVGTGVYRVRRRYKEVRLLDGDRDTTAIIAMIPLLGIYVYMSLSWPTLATQIPLMPYPASISLLVIPLILLLGLLGYWHAHITHLTRLDNTLPENSPQRFQASTRRIT